MTTRIKVTSRCPIDLRLSHVQGKPQPNLPSDTPILDNAIKKKGVQEKVIQDDDYEYHD